MTRVSTNFTLVLKFFIPTFWIVFFGAFLIAILIQNTPYYGSIQGGTFRIGTILFYLSGLAFFYFTFLRLKRVEMDDQFIVITDYFKAAKYPYESIDHIDERRFFFFEIATIHLKAKGVFGKRITFIGSGTYYHDFWENHPGLRKRLFIQE